MRRELQRKADQGNTAELVSSASETHAQLLAMGADVDELKRKLEDKADAAYTNECLLLKVSQPASPSVCQFISLSVSLPVCAAECASLMLWRILEPAAVSQANRSEGAMPAEETQQKIAVLQRQLDELRSMQCQQAAAVTARPPAAAAAGELVEQREALLLLEAALDNKASKAEVQQCLDLKANKESVASAFHRKVLCASSVGAGISQGQRAPATDTCKRVGVTTAM